MIATGLISKSSKFVFQPLVVATMTVEQATLQSVVIFVVAKGANPTLFGVRPSQVNVTVTGDGDPL
jgi:hypothetical protein